VPTGPGARRFSAPERRACWLFGARSVAILRGRGAESFGLPSSPDALSGLRRSILRRCRLRVAVVGDRVVRSSSADSGFHSPQAGAFGSRSERGGRWFSPSESRSNDSSRCPGFGNGTGLEATATGPSPADPFGERSGAIRVPARPSRAELVSRGPSGLGDAGEAQPARARKQVPFGVLVRKCGLVRVVSARTGSSLVRSLHLVALRGGWVDGRRHRARWPRPRSTEVPVIRLRPFGARGWSAGAEGERCLFRISGILVAFRGPQSLG